MFAISPGQRLDTIKMCHSTYFPNFCVSVIFTYCQNGGETVGLDFQYLEIDGVEFDTYWQNGGYKKISDIIFAEWHIFIVTSLSSFSRYNANFKLGQSVSAIQDSPPYI